MLCAKQCHEDFSFLLKGTEQHGDLVSNGQSTKKSWLLSTHDAFPVICCFHPSPQSPQVRPCPWHLVLPCILQSRGLGSHCTAFQNTSTCLCWNGAEAIHLWRTCLKTQLETFALLECKSHSVFYFVHILKAPEIEHATLNWLAILKSS